MTDKITPFTIIKGIRSKSVQYDPRTFEDVEAEYVPYLINRGLAFDSALTDIADLSNTHHRLPKFMQYDFLNSLVPRMNGYCPWVKSPKDDTEMADALMELYSCTKDKAHEMMLVLTAEQLEKLKVKHLNMKGGR